MQGMPAAPAAVKLEPFPDSGRCNQRPDSLHVFLFALSSCPPAAALGISAAAAYHLGSLGENQRARQEKRCSSSKPLIKLEEPAAPALWRAPSAPEQEQLRMSTQQPRSWEASSSESDCSASEGSEETRKADSSKNSDSDIRLSQSLRGSQQQQSGKDMAKVCPLVSRDQRCPTARSHCLLELCAAAGVSSKLKMSRPQIGIPVWVPSLGSLLTLLHNCLSSKGAGMLL